MFLKRLDIFGFKSFADRTQVEFADGITALLGPNGCGKSNVVDAVKWVLGEQAAKTLRAEKMEDVIFNGTENRKPLNVAEVTLTLTNEAGLLPLDMSEVEIKRRLYRSGESEYHINGVPAKLKEVRELFWDTGVGKAAYSVMEQGKIDQILSSKPEERRYLFEEAAGITRYKARGAEAERKLEKTEENIRQVEGILGEVKRSYDSLKHQSEKTLKYRTLRDEIFQLELDIQLLRLKQFRYEKDGRSGDLHKRRGERDAIKTEIDELAKSLEENLDAVNSLEEKLVEYQKNIYGLTVEKAAREKEGRLLTEQRSQHQLKITQNADREKAVVRRVEELNRDAAEQDGVVKDLLKQAADIGANIASFEESIRLASSRIMENDRMVREKEKEIRDLDAGRAKLEKDLEAITDDIVAALDAGLKEAGYSAQERRTAEEALGAALGRLRELLAGGGAAGAGASAAAGRGAWFTGAAKPPGLSPETAEEAGRLIDQAVALFENYRKSAPSFIDEFVAPQGIITRKREIDAEIRSNTEEVLRRREEIAGLREDNKELSGKIDQYKTTLGELRVNRARMDTQAKAAEEQARLLRRELAGQEGLLRHIQDETAAERKQVEELTGRIAGTESEIAAMEKRGAALSAELEDLEKDISRKNGAAAGKQESLKKRSADLARVQEALEKIHLDLVQTETEIKNIQDNFRETHSRDLLEFEERIFTITTPPAELREKLSGKKGGLRDLGSVNLMAPEEFAETKERFDFLSGQLEDLAKAKSDLEAMTAEIRHESSELFLATYNRIKKNFHNMFRRLFGGGRAELRLEDANHVLESGIEIFAQPPGKKLENIALLSGGEKSMTAVALLFATYMVKPSPFCLLDEIDAALDENNVIRFVHLLREFGDTSQFIVITHNKKTVTGARTLLGVTMEESGVTKLISIRLEHEEEAAARRDFLPGETFEEEDVEPEEGRELPLGINDPSQVSDAELRPIRASRPKAGKPAPPGETEPAGN
ncbi:MAG: AAA family ATPase [Treponema sp.]|jgi:chromosome segregation protein|nr:AAA family ATPase [Treponema sp.]